MDFAAIISSTKPRDQGNSITIEQWDNRALVGFELVQIDTGKIDVRVQYHFGVALWLLASCICPRTTEFAGQHLA